MDKKPFFSMIGINDRFGESGKPYDLIKEFGLSVEYIVSEALSLFKK